MDLGLKDRVALVGGSSKGLGRGCAVSLAREGAKVVLTGRDKGPLDETAALLRREYGVEVLARQIDFSDPSRIEGLIAEVVDHFGRLDILVVNSGGPRPGRFAELSAEDWRHAADAVLGYAIEFYRHAIPAMQRNGYGRIINISSLSVKQPAETLTLSNVYRTAVVSMGKTVSRDVIRDNITVNTVCPGAFKTDRAAQLLQAKAASEGITVEEAERAAVSRYALGRYQMPEELGDLVAFLASERAGGMTGTTIQVDGGNSASLF